MSEPQKDEGADAMGLRVTQSAELVSLASHAEPAASEGTRLKIVTVSPESGPTSVSDPELRTGKRRLKEDPYLGATIDGRYRVEAVLGEGGMGVVYRCSHTIIGKTVAMKVLHADLARDSEVTERFLNEAKSASAIGNPHIIDISDFGQFPDGSTYFIMEHLAGSPLSRALESGQRLPQHRALHIARQLAEGLAAAHEAGIVHRDLKPDNIFLIQRGAERDFVKILDFGIAKVSSVETGRLTRAGAVFGTPHYMSPEQAAGAAVDCRGDIYALGVILYEMTLGRVPFDADNFMAILSQHVHKTPPPLRDASPESQEVPEGLEAIVLKCLSKLPEQRYQTMLEFLEDLDALSEGETPEAVAQIAARPRVSESPLSAPSPAPSPLRWKIAAALAGALAAMAIVGFALREDGVPATPAIEKPVARATPLPAPPRPQTKQVVIAAEPLDAHIYRGSADLGASPVMLELAPGEELTLTVRRDGYRDATLRVGAKSPRHVVSLEKLVTESVRPAARPRVPTARKPATVNNGRAGGNDLVYPWENQN